MALPLMIAQSVVFVAGALLQRSLCPASTSSSSSRCCPSLILLHFITVLFSTCTLYSIPNLCKCVCRSASTLPLHRTPQRTARLHVTTKCPRWNKIFWLQATIPKTRPIPSTVPNATVPVSLELTRVVCKWQISSKKLAHFLGQVRHEIGYSTLVLPPIRTHQY